MEKEKRQLETKLDKLDKLSRALQQERIDLQATIKNLTKASTPPAPPAPPSTANPPENENEKTQDESANLYGLFSNFDETF